MANKRRALTVPAFGAIPKVGNSSLDQWLNSFVNGVQIFMRDIVEIGADYDLIAHVTRQTLAAGFTIDPDSHDIELRSDSAVTSNATTAIKNGRNGQTIVLMNVGSFNITLVDGANIEINRNTILYPLDTLTLKWSDTLVLWIVIGTGHLAMINQNYIINGNGNTGTGEDVIWTWTMPANTMVPNSMIAVSALIGFAANANTKTLKFHVGGSVITLNTVTTAPNNIFMAVEIKLWYENNGAVQYTAITHKTGAPATLETVRIANFSTTIDLSADMVIKFTGEGTTTNDIVCYRASAITMRTQQ